jgi:hypothetical protein
MEDFSFRRDFRRIDWPATLRLNLLRAVFAGLFWALLQLIAGQASALVALVMVAAFPIGYAGFMLPFGLVAAWLASVGVPFAAWITGVFAVIVAVGDPLVWVLHRSRPSWVPADRPAFMSLRLVIFVMRAVPVQQVDFRSRVAFEKD